MSARRRFLIAPSSRATEIAKKKSTLALAPNGVNRERRGNTKREREKMDEVRDTARSKRSVLNERERKKKGLEGEMGRDRGRWWS